MSVATRVAAALPALVVTGAARAEASQFAPGGFTFTHVLALEPDPEPRALTQPQRWMRCSASGRGA